MVGIGGRDRRRNQRSEEQERVRERRLIRDNGCLWYVLVFLAVMLLLSLMFGGFHKGTFHGSSGPDGGNGTSVTSTASRFAPF